MEIAPPPSGSRIQEIGDRLVVRFRPHRSWGAIAFLTFWWAFWTFGGIFALFVLPGASWGERAFLLVWLCGWAYGECFALVVIAWQLAGREWLTVTSQCLEVRQEIGRFARTTRYDVALIHDIQAALVPTDEDEKPRKDFCLRVSYDEKTVRVGEGMGEREAEYVASTVLSRIRPRSWWGEAADVKHAAGTPRADAAPIEAVRQRRVSTAVLSIAFPLVLVGALAFIFFHDHERSQPAHHDASARARGAVSSTRDSPDPRELASILTRSALMVTRANLLGRPDCGEHVTYAEWACTVTAQATIGPFAGRTLIYQCLHKPELERIVCGPAQPRRD